MTSWRQLSVMFVGASLMVGAGARAQNQTGLQFNLSTPGARSLAMGGAFLGLADDATAAYTNPAGLTNLAEGGSEVAIEARSWDYSSTFIAGGRLAGTPSGIGVDATPGLSLGKSGSRESGLSFVSAAYVFPKGFTLAVYRHQLANYSTSSASQGFFFVDTDGESRTNPALSVVTTRIRNLGISGAYELWHRPGPAGAFSVGLGFSGYQIALTEIFAKFDFFRRTDSSEFDRMPRGFYGPSDFLFDSAAQVGLSSADNSDIGVNLGFLWKVGREQRWSLGGVYRQGPRFESKGSIITRDLNNPERGLDQILVTRTIHVPDIYGLGIAYSNSNGNTKVTFDYDRVLHSQRQEDRIANEFRRDERIRDGNEIHLGLENVFMAIESQFVGVARFGVWLDPAHEVEYVGSREDLRALLPRGKNELHWTGGLGLVIKEDYQVDAAVDVSKRVKTLSVSLVRFF